MAKLLWGDQLPESKLFDSHLRQFVPIHDEVRTKIALSMESRTYANTNRLMSGVRELGWVRLEWHLGSEHQLYYQDQHTSMVFPEFFPARDAKNLKVSIDIWMSVALDT